MPLVAGQSLSCYEILGSLGAGGMGEVYRARDTRLEREVAVKVLPADLADDEERLARLEREARSLARVNDPNVAQIYGVDQVEHTCFLVLELVEGESLAERLARGPLTSGETLMIAEQIARGLRAAHAAGVVHRDLKPANVQLGPAGVVKLLDFGLAKKLDPDARGDRTETLQTQAGQVLGTPMYMSPEQATDRQVDERTDIWSFGCVLYECLTGRGAFQRSAIAQILVALLHEEPDWSVLPADVPEPFRELLVSCLAKDRDQRPVNASELLARLAALSTTSAIPALEIVPTNEPERRPFVGREEEKEHILAMMHSARRGGGGLMLLAGEPGVGKTRLAEEVLDEARRLGMLTSAGNSYEDGAAPFVTVVEVLENLIRLFAPEESRRLLAEDAPEIARLMPELRRRFPDLPEPMELPPEQQQRFLFNSVLAFVERVSSRAPLVVLLDDLHWADESSLLLLEHLVTHLPRLAVLVLVTYRDMETEGSEAFRRLMADLTRRRSAESISVGPLSADDVGRMLASVGGEELPTAVVERVFRITEGNAFFVEEVFHHLAERGLLVDEQVDWWADFGEHLDVPKAIVLVTGQRLDRLAEDTRRTLTMAAVQGPRFELPVLEESVPEVEDVLDAVEEAEGARLIRPETDGRGEGYRFVHGLVRRVLLTRLSRPRLQRLHHEVAGAIERFHGARAETHAAEIARHLIQAGRVAEPARTARFSALAGKQALGSSAFDEAVRCFGDALSFEAELGEDTRDELLYLRGVAFRGLGDWTRSAEDWIAALPGLERSRDAGKIEDVCSGLSFYYLFEGNLRDAASVADRGLSALPEGAERERCHLLSAAGSSIGLAGEAERGAALLDEAMEMADRLGAPLVRALVLQRRMQFLHGHILTAEGVEAGFTSAKLLRECGALWQQSNCITLLLVSLAWQGRLREARELADEHEALARRVGDLGGETCIVLARLLDAIARGGPAQAMELADRAVEVCRPLGFGMHALDYQAMVRFWGGSWEEAREISKRAVAQERSDVWDGWETAHRVLIGAYLGEVPVVEVDRLPRAGRANGAGRWAYLLALVEAFAMTGELARAAELEPLVREAIATKAEYAWCFGYIQKIAAIAAAAGDSWEEAEERFALAERRANELPHRVEQGEVARWTAWMLVRRDAPGDRDRAEELLDRATAAYRKIGMPRHARLVEEMRTGRARP